MEGEAGNLTTNLIMLAAFLDVDVSLMPYMTFATTILLSLELALAYLVFR